MTIHAALTHRTTYTYDRPVRLGAQVVRLRPAPHCRTPILSYAFKVTPENHFINWQQDPFGNFLARLVFPEPASKLEVVVDLSANMAAINPFDFFLEDEASHMPFGYAADLASDLLPYLTPIGGGPLFKEIVAAARRRLERATAYHTIDFLVDVNRDVQERVAYLIRMEPGVQAPEETLVRAAGSCRDSGWLLVALMRELGLAARFVSGYLIQLTADEKAVDGPTGPEADFTDLHAWAEIYVPGAGWVGLDPTSGLLAGEGHIPLAATPEPRSAAPITGALEPCEVTFDFAMEVRRIHEAPRPSLPFTEAAWQAIDAAGQAVDERLRAQDVRLTMGGEPTFVAAQDRDAAEWNTEAVGPNKRAYADALIRRLRERFAPGGLLHYGQGKWYPGEQLPRWAFALYWRRDDVPLWGRPELVAREAGGRAADAGSARRFAQALAAALEIEPEFVQAAYEDPAEFLLKERKLAPNLDPLDNRLEDPQERARVAKVFDRGLTTPSGFVLPIQAAQARASGRRHLHWRSEQWRTRRGRLFLVPGDSPVGFRLPLRGLAHLNEGEYPFIHPLDPFAAHAALPARPPQLQARSVAPFEAAAPAEDEPEFVPLEDAAADSDFLDGGPAVRTAVAVEARDGIVSVFVPPVTSADEYVDLVQAIEEAAASLGQTVHVEGYPPPPDPRLNVIKITPDPGVLEINIHPAHSWAEQVAITETLYEQARACRLDSSKFMVDGRPTGSGGGAHVVVGGASAPDSPFLRRPDLLGSLLRYWQNHPSLSYLFSGLFIGPTSQAPRIDEARNDSLYELEIALSRIPMPGDGADCPPWLVDRLFRHLLTDVTGNTHRAEICIDKLYSPDGPTGRLGLVEFRAFEMPPHPRMSLAQQLVLRGLIAWFWAQPYTRPLLRFGTALHDRYLLPHHLWTDFEGVLAEMGEALGIAFEPVWFEAQREFRFPVYGTATYRGIEIELRAALEPWHVLGEEGAVGGTTRFVDSSVERMQVRVTGDLDERFTLTCNGLRLPLQSTERRDERVAGVRYRSWLPASCLHPTIEPHGPLVFDLVDRWNGRSLGGCTYHVTHPGGRNFETQPVNALEAEGRRLARFEAYGNTPGSMAVREPRLSPEFPWTLDLRLQ